MTTRSSSSSSAGGVGKPLRTVAFVTRSDGREQEVPDTYAGSGGEGPHAGERMTVEQVRDIARSSAYNRVPADLRGADLRGLALESMDLRNARLDGADLRGADIFLALDGASLRDARLDGAHILYSDLARANVEGATFTNATIRESRLPQLQASGADFTNAEIVKSDLTHADFRGAVLNGAQLTRIQNASDADFREAYLTRTVLQGVFDRANFGHAHIEGADLGSQDGFPSSFTHADFSHAALVNTRVEGSYFYETTFDQTEYFGTPLDKNRTIELEQLATANPKKPDWYVGVPKGGKR